jgi:hypothetical protein
MNIFDPDNGEYGKITFDILSELGIFNMESFLNPHYWDAEELFKSDIIIKNIDQANAANHLECIHSFLRDRETLQTIEGCTAFNLASPDVNGISPFMRSFIPHALFPGQRVPLGTKMTFLTTAPLLVLTLLLNTITLTTMMETLKISISMNVNSIFPLSHRASPVLLRIPITLLIRIQGRIS